MIHKLIAINYLKTWFLIDLVSIIPLDLMFDGANINSVLRFARIGKLYKLIRLVRLVKMIKIMRTNQNTMHNFSERLKISGGTERLGTFTFFFIIFLHVSSCLFIMIAGFEDGWDGVIRWID